MPLITTFAEVAKYLTDVTPEDIGRCQRVIGPDGRSFYAVESESAGVGPDGELIEYHVRYSRERGFTCTCPAGVNGFEAVRRHPSKVCKHVRWVCAAIIEERGYMAELTAAEESRREAEEAAQTQEAPDWYDGRNETSYADGTRAHLLISGKLEADDATYTRVMLAKPYEPSEVEIQRDQRRYQSRPFQLER